VFVIVYPLALAIIAHRRLRVSWRYFWYGVLIFLLFQLVTRVPLFTILGIALAPTLRASAVALWVWLGVEALTAGLAEEIGRYVGYRWLMGREEKTWSKAVMYGIGHGGLESIVLVGGGALLSLVSIIATSAVFNQAALSAAQRHTVVAQFAALAAQPGWEPLLGGWERLWTLPFHIALSVVVLQVFRRKQLRWLWVAVGAHALFDFIAVGLIQTLSKSLPSLTASLIAEGFIAVVGLIAVWVVFALRDTGARTTTPEAQAPQVMQPMQPAQPILPAQPIQTSVAGESAGLGAS
jgi:uncharacterized membrane protein YhfC